MCCSWNKKKQESHQGYPAFLYEIIPKRTYFILYISEPANKKQPNP